MRPNKPWLDTHFYDKNISKETLEKIKPFIKISKKISKEDKLLCFDRMRIKLDQLKTDDIGMKYYDQMIDSYKKDDGKNYDPINKIDPIDLLYVVCSIFKDNKDVILLLDEQLKDLRSGFCPQGRSIRLIQIVNSFL